MADRTIVWDNHACMPLDPDDTTFLPQLQRYRDSGVDVVSLNVGFDALGAELAPQMLATMRSWLAERADAYALATSVASIEAAGHEGKLAVCFDLEGGTALDGRLDRVQRFYDLGVRWMLIAYNRNNALGGGCQDEDGGLTEFGRKVVAEMARVGMVTCCSHTGERTSYDVIEAASNPVILSHSNPRALVDHPRNVSDDLMRAVAATGGVVGIVGNGIFLGDNDISTGAVVRHIDYAVQLIGPDHVGLGLDYVFDLSELEKYVKSQAETFPARFGYDREFLFVEPEQTPMIAERLVELGYSQDAVASILGGNWMRVARRVWK
ncbi:MAG: dipeptidase [Gemmatimonadota bacterium]